MDSGDRSLLRVKFEMCHKYCIIHVDSYLFRGRLRTELGMAMAKCIWVQRNTSLNGRMILLKIYVFVVQLTMKVSGVH